MRTDSAGNCVAMRGRIEAFGRNADPDCISRTHRFEGSYSSRFREGTIDVSFQEVGNWCDLRRGVCRPVGARKSGVSVPWTVRQLLLSPNSLLSTSELLPADYVLLSKMLFTLRGSVVRSTLQHVGVWNTDIWRLHVRTRRMWCHTSDRSGFYGGPLCAAVPCGGTARRSSSCSQ